MPHVLVLRCRPLMPCLLAAALLPTLLGGCAAMAVSLAGAGAGVGLAHQLNGTASRTFSEPLPQVASAASHAARRMDLKVGAVTRTDQGTLTEATVSGLQITIQMSPLSNSLTRVDVVARKNFLQVDAATAQEIVAQIGNALEDAGLAEASVAEREAGSTPIFDVTPAPRQRRPARFQNAI